MKKGLGLLILLIVLLVIAGAYKITPKQITGSTITGNATSAGVSISITVAGVPTLEILRPENETYFTATNLWLNFTAFSADVIKYNLDNGANSTITGNTIFNTSSGQHTLYLWANNSDGSASESVTFTVDLPTFKVTYGDYLDKGSSTDFNKSSYEDIQNLSGIVLEHSATGKIAFNQAINLTNDSTYTDKSIDIDSHANISQNFISINTTALPNLNKSATLSLYGLSLSNPRVLRNGEACPSAICTEVSYSGGTFVFNVTHFSNYSADETPAGEEAVVGGGGGSGGGGGGPGVSGYTFAVDKEQLSFSLHSGEVVEQNVTITNTGKYVERIEIENLLKDFIVRSDEAIVLNPGESKIITLYAIARIDTAPDIYLGKLIVDSGSMKKEILISVEVESKDLLLDVRAEIIKPYKKVLPGGEILSEIRLFNLGGDAERKDVEMVYMVRDYGNNTLLTAHESLAIETQASFIKKFDISQDAQPGDYVLYVQAIYEDKTASSSDTFKIVGKEGNLILYIAGGIVLLVLLIIIIRRVSKVFSRGKGGERSRGISDYRKRLERYK